MPAVLGVSLDQGPKVLAKGKGKTVSLPCKASGLSSSDYIHWYQIKDGEAPSRLLFISQGEIPAAVLGVSVVQDPKVLVKGKGKTVFLPCKATGMGSSDYIHWYQIIDGWSSFCGKNLIVLVMTTRYEQRGNHKAIIITF
ncbi:T-cell receptor [Labeo rohita]|nr:T-cell receptor [Labeo rohita]